MDDISINMSRKGYSQSEDISTCRLQASLTRSSCDMRTLRHSAQWLVAPSFQPKERTGTPKWTFLFFGGEKGIRTLETVLGFTRFPVVRLRPTRPSLQDHYIITDVYAKVKIFFSLLKLFLFLILDKL